MAAVISDEDIKAMFKANIVEGEDAVEAKQKVNLYKGCLAVLEDLPVRKVYFEAESEDFIVSAHRCQSGRVHDSRSTGQQVVVDTVTRPG